MIRNITILLLLSLSYTADHLLLIQVVTQPNEAESFSIYNPTDSPINLSNYYICDDEEYYNISIYPDSMFSSIVSGYTSKFPDTFIASGDTFHIVLNENYSEFYGEDFVPDLIMYGSNDNSMLETVPGSIGFSNNKIAESSELIILFKWDGESDHLIEDVDYFLWGEYHPRIDKTGILTYQEDTPEEDQLYFDEVAQENYAY